MYIPVQTVLTFLAVPALERHPASHGVMDHGTTCFLFRATMLLCVQFEGTIGAEGLTFKFLERRLNNSSPDNVWYCRCLPVLFFTIVVRTDVMGSVRIKCALLSKLEPYGAPDPEPDDWMRKAASETCRHYQLAPTPRLFASVRPITAILGKVPMVRAGNTGTIPFNMRGHERAYYPGGRCDSVVDKGDGSRLWYVNTWAMKWSQKE